MICAKKIHDQQGMISIEMLLILSMYVMFFAGIMILINGFIIQYRLQTAVNETAKETAAYAAADPGGTGYAYEVYKAFYKMNGIKFENWGDEEADRAKSLCFAATNKDIYYKSSVYTVFLEILTDMDADIDTYLKDHGVAGGINGLILHSSQFEENGELTVTLTYNFHCFKIPFSDGWLFSKKMGCSASTRAWVP